MTSPTAAPPSTRVKMQEAIDLINRGVQPGQPKRIGYGKLHRMVRAGEFTESRDGDGRGFRVFLLRDEVEEYERGGLPSLRKFRTKKGRAGR